jgi:hypothetical protein
MGNKEIWLFLFFLGVLLFNWPFLSIFGGSLPYYLFIMWGVFIAGAGAIIIRSSGSKRAD